MERDHQGDRLQGRLAQQDGRAPAVLSRFAQPAEAEAARGRVRCARARVRAARRVPVRRTPAVHARRRAQGEAVRTARDARRPTLRDRPVHLPRLRQSRRRRCDRREKGGLPRRRARSARGRRRRAQAPRFAGILRRALQFHEPPRQASGDRGRDRAHAASRQARLAPAGAFRGFAHRRARALAQALRRARRDRSYGARSSAPPCPS